MSTKTPLALIQAVKSIPKSFMARDKSSKIYVLIMASILLLNLIVGNILLAFIYLPFVWQAWTTTKPTTGISGYADWTWQRSLGFFLTPIWVTFMVAYFSLSISNIFDGNKTTHPVVSLQEFWNTISYLWPFWVLFLLVLSGFSFYLHRKIKGLSKRMQGSLIEMTLLAQIEYPNVPWDITLSPEQNKELYHKALEETEGLRRELKSKWMEVEMPTARKLLLIRLDVMPEEAHSERAQSFTEEDIEVYNTIKRFSRKGIEFLAD